MRSAAAVFKEGAIQGFAELRSVYTLKTWLASWFMRVMLQVVFFALVGQLYGADQLATFMIIGNAVVLVAIEATIVVVSAAGERGTGTLGLLISAPSSPVFVFMGRGIQWVFTGTVTATVALLTLPWLLGLPISFGQSISALWLIPIIGLSSYAYGLALSGISVRNWRYMWLVLNVGYFTLMTFSGVNVPVSYWPEPLETITRLLPVTNGLEAVRQLIDGAAATSVLPLVAAEILVGCAWLGGAVVTYRWFFEKGRREGTLDFI